MWMFQLILRLYSAHYIKKGTTFIHIFLALNFKHRPVSASTDILAKKPLYATAHEL